MFIGKHTERQRERDRHTTTTKNHIQWALTRTPHTYAQQNLVCFFLHKQSKCNRLAENDRKIKYTRSQTLPRNKTRINKTICWFFTPIFLFLSLSIFVVAVVVRLHSIPFFFSLLCTIFVVFFWPFVITFSIHSHSSAQFNELRQVLVFFFFFSVVFETRGESNR